MSHLCEIEREFRDVEALRAALRELGLELGDSGKVQFYFSNERSSMTKEDKALEQVDHVVRIPGSKYTLGFRRQPNGSLKPVCDSELIEGSFGMNDKGRHLLGEKGIKLWQEYAFAGAKMQALKTGKVVHVGRTYQKDGSMQIRVRLTE